MYNTVMSLRYVFGCKHDNRDFKTSMVFENGIRLPVILCKDCTEESK